MIRSDDVISLLQSPQLFYPENTPSDPLFSGYNIYGTNPFGSVNNVITAWNLVKTPPDFPHRQ